MEREGKKRMSEDGVELKVGSWYRTRSNAIVKIIDKDQVTTSEYPWVFLGTNSLSYRQGGWFYDKKWPDNNDLVSEIRPSDDVPVFLEEPAVEMSLTPWISEIVYTNEHTSTNLELPMTDDQIRAEVENILLTRSGVQTLRVYKLAHTVSRKTTLSWE